MRRLWARRSPETPPARYRAMLLVGFGAALGRSELVALTLGDVETVPGRLSLLVRRGKPTSTAPPTASPFNPGDDLHPAQCL